MMAARADAAPGPHLDIGDVVRVGRRRVWRRRAAGGSVACAVLAALTLIAPSVLPNGDDDPSFVGGLGERQISYASGSTIHDGDQAIDVSPHRVDFYVQTDDGFVYAAQNGVHFTDGEGSEKIGTHPSGEVLVADDTGSYVGWVESQRDGSQAVVYDTARGRDVFRSPKLDSHSRGCFGNVGGSLGLTAIDGDVAYICDGSDMTAWNLTTNTSQWSTPHRPGHPGKVWLTDVNNGYLAWSSTEFADTRGTIVSREPEADEPSYPEIAANQLSPDANYIAGGENGHSVVFDRTTNQEVDLDMPEYQEWYVMRWLGNDLFTAMGFHAKDADDAREAPDLLTCDASSAMCKVVGQAQASGGAILPPTGISYWM
jgi:hypothetical protein